MTVAFDGYIAGPVLLAMAVVVAIAGRRDDDRAVGRDRVRRRRRRHLPELRAAELTGRGHRDDRRGGRFHAGREPPAGGMRDHDRVVVEAPCEGCV